MTGTVGRRDPCGRPGRAARPGPGVPATVFTMTFTEVVTDEYTITMASVAVAFWAARFLIYRVIGPALVRRCADRARGCGGGYCRRCGRYQAVRAGGPVAPRAGPTGGS